MLKFPAANGVDTADTQDGLAAVFFDRLEIPDRCQMTQSMWAAAGF